MKMNKNDDNKNVEELMKSATEKINYDEEKDNNKKSPKKLATAIILGSLIIGGSVFVGSNLIKKPQEFVDKTETPEWINKKNDGIPKIDAEVDKILEPYYPIKRYEWAKMEYPGASFLNNNDILNEVLEVSRNEYNKLYSSIAWINSGGLYEKEEKVDGNKYYTNNINKEFNEDGSKNPLFSYAILEDYEKAYVTYAQRLLNPDFGGWDKIQRSTFSDIKNDDRFQSLKDMFSLDWWNDNIKESSDYSKLPIMAEWEKDSWNKYELTEENVISGFFYGEVSQKEGEYITVETLGQDDKGQPILKINTPIIVKAFNNKEELIELSGSLNLTLKSNEDYLNEENRVVIDDANFVLN